MPEFTLFPGNAPVAVNAGDGGAVFANSGPAPAFYGPGELTPVSAFLATGDTVTLYGTQYFALGRFAQGRADIDYKLLAQVDAAPTDPGAGASTGVSLVPPWAPGKDYLATQIVQADGRLWLAKSNHRSSSTFSQDRDLLWGVLVGSATGIVTLTLSGAPITVGVTKRSWVAPVDGTLLAVSADSDATLTLDITRNGVSIFSTVANRPVMNSANAYIARERLPDTVVFKAGDKFTILPTSLQHSSRTPGAGSSSVTSSATSTGPTINVPAPTTGSAIAVGDIIFIAGKVNTADTTATTIAVSGFTEVGTGVVRTNAYEYHVYWKRADSGDAAASTFPVVVTGTVTGYVFDLVTYRDMIGSGSPIDITSTLPTSFSAALTLPSLAPSLPDEVRVAFIASFSAQSVSSLPSMTSRTARVYDRNLSGQPASTGTDVATMSSTNYAGAIVLTLKPGVGDDTTTYGNVNLRYVPAVASDTSPVILDTTAPTVPTSFAAVATSSSVVKLTWVASTDNVGVAGYEVSLADGTILKPAVTSLLSTVAGLTASTAYSFRVRAFDAAGNFSTYATAGATTPAAAAATGSYVVDGIYMRDPAGAIFTPYGFNMGIAQAIGGNFTGVDESVVNVTNGTPHIAELLEWGCNAVRMFVYVSDSTSWIAALGRTNAWNKIKAAIDLYRAAGIVVIVTPADMTGANAGRVVDHENDVVEFLATVGATYAADSGVWWNVNEPAVSLLAGRTGNYNTDWLAVHERMYAALRTTAGNPNIYIMDGPGAAQDPGPTQVSGTDFAGNPWQLKRVYDSDMGPAFITGKSNVLFGLHNYGWQAGPTSPLSSFISAYTTYLTNVHNAGLAMIMGEADTALNSRPEIVINDDRRQRYGFQSMIELAPQFAVGFMFWFGTSIDLNGPKYDKTAGNNQGRPWWYLGSSTRLSDSGARFWNLLHATAQVPVATIYPTISSAAYTVGVTLTATPGTWLPSGTITYQWRRTIGSTHTLIAGETNPSYVVQPADIGAGYRLSCVIQCDNSNGSGAQDTGYATSS